MYSLELPFRKFYIIIFVSILFWIKSDNGLKDLVKF